MAASRAWKEFEKKVAAAVGGKRRGAVREGSKETDDVIHDDISVECKLLAQPTYSAMLDACKQAERICPAGKLPLAVVGRKGKELKNALVIMRFERFLEHDDSAEESELDAQWEPPTFMEEPEAAGQQRPEEEEEEEPERFDAQQFVVPAEAVPVKRPAKIQYDFDDPSDIDPGVIDDEV
jgi:hypothetical protein